MLTSSTAYRPLLPHECRASTLARPDAYAVFVFAVRVFIFPLSNCPNNIYFIANSPCRYHDLISGICSLLASIYSVQMPMSAARIGVRRTACRDFSRCRANRTPHKPRQIRRSYSWSAFVLGGRRFIICTPAFWATDSEYRRIVT